MSVVDFKEIGAENSPYIPDEDDKYVKFGHYPDVLTIIKSKRFMPFWITGLAGNGKTQMIEQAAAEAKREFFRVNFTTETDEADLLGAQRLIEHNGTTITEYDEGVVPLALRRGGILLLDEISAGHTNKIMCLQSVLEGKGVFLKQKKEWVRPARGFQIFATCNTKGQGDETGQFIGTNILNAAMRDRFVGMFEQNYPDAETEYKILMNYFIEMVLVEGGRKPTDPDAQEITDKGKNFITTLTAWAKQIREAHEAGADLQDIITTRTLISIIKSYAVFGKKNKSIKFACNRYSNDARDQFMQAYDALNENDDEDEEVIPNEDVEKHRIFKNQ